MATKKLTLTTAFAALCLATPLALAGCSSTDAAEKPADNTASTEHAHADSALTATDTWAKAGDEGGMTGAFAVLQNSSDKALSITALSSDVSKTVEMHEVVNGTMRPVAKGFEIPANGELVLEPGGLHFMLMDLTRQVLAGDDIHITATLSDGSETELHFTVRDYSGANESYESGTGDSGENGDSHGDGESTEHSH